MTYTFKKLTVDDLDTIKKYSSLRPIYTSEGQFMNQFIWASFYQTEFAVTEKYLFFKMKINNEDATMMPYCKVEDIPEAFADIKNYFNETLQKPLKMYIVDQLFLDHVSPISSFSTDFEVAADRNCFDYMYDAEKLKTLSGKAYHKKKNHLNSFLKTYEGRFEYRTLCCCNMDEIKQFYHKWLEQRQVIERMECITGEEDGVVRIFENCSQLDCKMGGIYVDGNLESFSIGSYAPHLKCAFIHVEKGNLEIKGIYNYINQQFLIHEFPEAELVNREDDLGQEGLRKAKLSYRPIRLEEKFNIFQK